MKKPIDTHCHLDLLFEKKPEYKNQLAQWPVSKVIVPGLFPKQWDAIDQLKAQSDQIKVAYGIHPWFVDKIEGSIERTIEALSQKIQNCHPIAIGECGLDALIQLPLEKQLPIFESQLQLADLYELPLIIHTRKTHQQILENIKKHLLPRKGVIHGYCGSQELAQEYLKKGFFIGVGGSITYPRARKTRKAIATVPMSRIVLETDSPDMPVFGKQGQPNTPENLTQIIQCLSELKQLSPAKIIDMTNENVHKLFY